MADTLTEVDDESAEVAVECCKGIEVDELVLVESSAEREEVAEGVLLEIKFAMAEVAWVSEEAEAEALMEVRRDVVCSVVVADREVDSSLVSTLVAVLCEVAVADVLGLDVLLVLESGETEERLVLVVCAELGACVVDALLLLDVRVEEDEEAVLTEAKVEDELAVVDVKLVAMAALEVVPLATAVLFAKMTMGVMGHGRNWTDRFVRRAHKTPFVVSGIAIADKGVEIFGKVTIEALVVRKLPARSNVQLRTCALDEVPSTL